MRKLLFIFAAVLLSSIGLHAGTQITYKATERLELGTLNPGATTFGSPIKSHDFSDGVGTITCSGEITQIGDGAFKGCRRMTSVDIPNSVTRIGNFAFGGTELLSIVIPDFVTSIGMEAFGGCTSLTVMTIGQSVKEFLYTALWNCTALKTIYCFPLNPPSLDVDIFRNIPREGLSVYVLDVKAYSDQSAWGSQLPASCFKRFLIEIDGIKYEILEGNKARVIGKDGGYIGNIIIPEQITFWGKKFTVTEIADGTFSHSGITSITLPPSITKIGMGVFEYCGQLQSITLPSSVSIIGDGAFQFTGLTSITIPASVERIGHWAFQECPNLKEVIIPSSSLLTFIGEKAFYKTGLTSVTIPALVEQIENDAFLGCPLEYVFSMSETPPTLGERSVFPNDKNAFVYVPTPEATVAYRSSKWGEYFTKIYSYITYRQTSSNTVEVIDAFPNNGKVEIPAMFSSLGTFYKVTGIADSAFYEEDSLVSISLPSGIQYIGNNAFNGCEKLKDINIEYIEDLQTIGDYAFYNCYALGSIVIPEGVQSLGKAAFMRCKNLTHISLPTGLKNIPDECFCMCPLGTEIIVPEGVETIGAYGFQSSYSSTETLITLPSTLKELKNYAFANRTGLNKVICLADTPPNLGISIFYNQKTAIVYVPDRDAMKIYRDSSSWKNYKFTFADLMAEENKAYLYEVAGNNIEAQDTARHYCLLIDNAQNTAEVQNYTTIALERIDKLTLTDYKNALADSLDRYAQGNAEAQQIAGQYTPRIRDAYSRPAAEQLFTEAYKKIAYIYELIKLKQNYKDQLIKLADGDEDLLRVATNYGALIDHAETKEEARELYERATMRMNINKQINYDWKGGSVKVNNHTCSTTKGYK